MYFRALAIAVTLALCAGCANFRKLGFDLDLLDRTYVVSADIGNRSKFENVFGLVVQWDRAKGKVLSADFCPIGEVGVFGFLVDDRDNQFLMAFSDANSNGKYDVGEGAWIHSDEAGQATPVNFDVEGRKARIHGELATDVRLPEEMIVAGREFRGNRDIDEAATGWDIPVALGELAALDDPKFAAVRGEEGLWQPATFPLELGIGVYFLERYDPLRIPVLFVYGAAGSPQDWRTFFRDLDKSKYQAWFYFYPTGMRLEKAGVALNRSVEFLQGYFQFERLHIVAHSMGGLVSRSFLIENMLNDGNTYIDKFVTISTPWSGHEAAELGVKHAPKVVPSWYDMQTNSDFQKRIFSSDLSGKVEHLLLYGHHSSKSRILPDENDGTVSVESMTAPAAVEGAVEVIGYDADHVNILSRPDVIAEVNRFLAAPRMEPKPSSGLGDTLKKLNPFGD
jgi:hypothetical protein